MTPGARISAAIEILDSMRDGLAAEQALTRWARSSRFAGSKDRAAVRDHVFDVLRQRRSAAHFGGGETGRALMIGLLRMQEQDLALLFNGEGHAPAALTDDERRTPELPAEKGVAWDLPDWLVPLFATSLDSRAEAVARRLQSRAPITLRVNLAKTDIASAAVQLAEAGIRTEPNELCETALTVTDGERKIRNSASYLQGDVELQDASSQAIVAAIPASGRILDYCTGGGGKALALAAVSNAQVFAHDIDPRRMSDLPARADRAGVEITQVATDRVDAGGAYDTVLCDAPCSGSGSWRRSPEAKWTLTQQRLDELTQIQDSILDKASGLIKPDGLLVYATCSVLTSENEDRVNAFLARQPEWKLGLMRRYDVTAQGDGFFTAHLMRV